MAEKQTNWARNYTYSTDNWHYPESVAEVQAVVRRCDKLRVVGSRHSFNSIADSTENIVSLANLEKLMVLDREQRTVTVAGGVRYGDLCGMLHAEGFALHNLASLPHISIAGACATGTHGSGSRNGNLATGVSAIEIITADGELLTLSREKDGDTFYGAVVGLGGLGVVIKTTLDIDPTFEVRQNVYENLPLSQFVAQIDEIMSHSYSVSLFTDWQNDRGNQLWLKQRLTADAPEAPLPNTLFGAAAAPTHRHPIVALSTESCTEQMGLAGPWHERLPHFRMEFTPSSGDELQTEYFVPRHLAQDALRAVMQLSEQITPLLQITEVRTIAADNFWLSPCYQQDCVAIHFTWQPQWTAVRELLPILEESLAPYAARPHWGKLFTMPPVHLAALYEKVPDFRQLCQQLDPQGKFRNAFLDSYIFSAA